MSATSTIWVIAGLVVMLQLTLGSHWVSPITEVRRGLKDRVEYVKAVLTKAHAKGGKCFAGTGTNNKVRHYAKTMGCKQDCAGHLVARCLGGVAKDYNIVPQECRANGEFYREVESKIFVWVEEGKTLTYEVEPVYHGRIPTRPSTLNYKVTEGSKVLLQGTKANPEPHPCTHLKPKEQELEPAIGA